MEYIKFNCFDLAAQNVELHGVHRRMQILSEELAHAVNSLDPQIKSYESIQHQFAAVGAAVDDVTLRILNAHNALDQAIDQYYSAEQKVNQTVEELPTELMAKISRRGDTNASPPQTASISSGDLIMEDWLAEMVYKFGK